MGTQPAGKIPFRVNRENKVSLTDQIISGMINALRSGYYKPGARLSTIKEMARELETSDLVVRNAIQRLSEMGEVVARPKTGIKVVDSGMAIWQSHVLFINRSRTYFFATRDGHFADLLDEAGVRVTTVCLDSKEYSRGMPRIKTVLDCGPVDLVVIEETSIGVASELERRKIPFVSIVDPQPSKRALGILDVNMREAYAELARRCPVWGVESVAAIFPLSASPDVSFEDVFSEAGIPCEVLFGSTSTPTLGHPEEVERAGWNAVKLLLDRNRTKLPDLIYFNDDYAARGGLTALLASGVHVPEDVQVVALTNYGHCPIFPKDLTRFELNPYEAAEAMSDLVQKVLKTGKVLKHPIWITPRFHAGETTKTPV